MTIYNHRQTCKCSSEYNTRRDTDLASTASTTRRSSGNSATSCSVPSVDDDADDVTSWPPATFPFPVTRAVSSCGAAEPGAWRRGAGFGGAGLLTTVDVISINIHHTYVGRQCNKQLLIITML